MELWLIVLIAAGAVVLAVVIAVAIAMAVSGKADSNSSDDDQLEDLRELSASLPEQGTTVLRRERLASDFGRSDTSY